MNPTGARRDTSVRRAAAEVHFRQGPPGFPGRSNHPAGKPVPGSYAAKRSGDPPIHRERWGTSAAYPFASALGKSKHPCGPKDVGGPAMPIPGPFQSEETNLLDLP
jgi:hypothetical protein